MKITLQEIASLTDGKIKNNDGTLIITGVGDIDTAQAGQITFIKNKEYFDKAKKSAASAILVPPEIEDLQTPVIIVNNPYLAFIKLLEIVSAEKRTYYKGIHKTAILGDHVQFAQTVSIGPYSVIGNNVKLDDKTVIGSNVFIGDNVTMGKNCFIYPNVSIREDTILGNNVIIHCGTVIGGDGCGFMPQGESYIKIPQVGRVILEDDVEVGSNVTIDRATISATVIGKGTKIDNLVHIAHNVTIGENSMILAHVTIAGSTKIGKHAIFSGQSGAIDNLKIGDNVIAASRAGILQDVPDNSVVWGMPAIDISDQKKITIATRKLPDMLKEVKEIKKKLESLTEEIEKLKK
jgi:UDP-3-O-[3-hydroxymyristoyl] glucosamine N-acyltransferase